jgi:hypothetical protein
MPLAETPRLAATAMIGGRANTATKGDQSRLLPLWPRSNSAINIANGENTRPVMMAPDSRGMWTSRGRAFILAVAAASAGLIQKLNDRVEMTKPSSLAVPMIYLMESKHDCYD